MPTETWKKLEKVLTERMRMQVENPDDDHTKYTHEELLGFALEEAHLNGELDFLAAPSPCLDTSSSLPIEETDREQLMDAVAQGMTSGILDTPDHRIVWQLHANKFTH